MEAKTGEVRDGPFGRAIEVILEGEPPSPDVQAQVATWFLICPGQSPAWDCYFLSLVHLRPIEGGKPPVISREGATHEVMLFALDADRNPVPDDFTTWNPLWPQNFVGQYTAPDDETAKHDAKLMALAVIHGITWAEPPLSGQREPWEGSLRKLEEHHRGEHSREYN